MIPVLESWTWPWEPWTLHLTYLLSGLLIAIHYLPQVWRAWHFPSATLTTHSLLSWSVWTACRGVAFGYGVFVVHDLGFLIVAGADILGCLTMATVIARAHILSSDLIRPIEPALHRHDGRRRSSDQDSRSLETRMPVSQ